MSGEKKSQKEKLAEYEQVLDDYKSKLGISELPLSSEVRKYLSMNKEMLQSLSAEECGEAGFMLTQYSAFLQTQYNRQNTKLLLAKDALNKIVISEAANYGYNSYMKYEMLESKVIIGNEAASVLNQIILRANAVKSELENMPNKIAAMATELKGLQISKNKRN